MKTEYEIWQDERAGRSTTSWEMLAARWAAVAATALFWGWVIKLVWFNR